MSWQPKLEWEAVHTIRAYGDAGMSATELARRFGRTPDNIRRIIRRESFKNIPEADLPAPKPAAALPPERATPSLRRPGRRRAAPRADARLPGKESK